MSIYPSGTIIENRYEVVQGPLEKSSLAGGMGLVYLCVDHEEDGKPVALKTFRPELLSDRAARDRFLREGTTWVELGYHPHIVRCYEVFRASMGQEVFFALELVAAAEGKNDASLRSWLIPNKPLPLAQALLFALHICHGMAHATHKIPGMVHRDLKPENILIGSDGRARVTDFGLASAAQNLDSDWQADDDASSPHIRTQLTHGIAGTPLYMAPEQWTGEPLDERVDIYAFGCILYEMICGSFAVAGRSIQELEQAHRQGQLNPIPAGVSSVLNGLLQRCLARATADRYPDWTELETDIANAYTNIIGEPAPVIPAEAKDILADRIAVGWSYNAMGISYKDIGKFAVARDYFEQVLTIARQYRDRALEGVALGNLGTAYGYLGDARRAIAFYEQQLAIARELGDRHGKGNALSGLGIAYSQLGDVRRAIGFYEGHLTIARELGDQQSEGNALSSLGIAYSQLGDARRAIDFHEGHLAIARELGDRRGEGRALGNLGIANRQIGDARRAIEFYEKWLVITQDIGDRHGEGQALCNLGSAYCYLGDARRAIEFFDQGLAIARELGDRHGEGQALGNLGSAYRQLGDARRAIAFYEQRLAIARELGDRHGERNALSGLGNAYSQLGDARVAIEFYEQGLAIAREIGDIVGVANSNFNMALLYQQDNPSKALAHAREAQRLSAQIGHEQYAARAQALIDEIRG